MRQLEKRVDVVDSSEPVFVIWSHMFSVLIEQINRVFGQYIVFYNILTQVIYIVELVERPTKSNAVAIDRAC